MAPEACRSAVGFVVVVYVLSFACFAFGLLLLLFGWLALFFFFFCHEGYLIRFGWARIMTRYFMTICDDQGYSNRRHPTQLVMNCITFPSTALRFLLSTSKQSTINKTRDKTKSTASGRNRVRMEGDTRWGGGRDWFREGDGRQDEEEGRRDRVRR